MKMWKTYWNSIIEVDVDRVSDSFVWIGGRRNAIRSSYDNYHESFDAAKAFLVAKANYDVARARHNLDRALSNLAVVEALQPASGGAKAVVS